MRIRRRPQPSLPPSDPSTSPRNAARNRGCLEDDAAKRLHANVALDLGRKSGVARRLALLPRQQQDNGVDCCGKRLGAQRGADDVHMSLLNGLRGSGQKGTVKCTGGNGSESATVAAEAEEETVSNGAVAVKDGKDGSNGGSGGGAKKRRDTSVLMEGSRCSRVNGRGWRCSQPTLVGYALCEHHLGKGRMMRGASGARGGATQLGRTEHGARLPATEEPKAEETTGLRRR